MFTGLEGSIHYRRQVAAFLLAIHVSLSSCILHPNPLILSVQAPLFPYLLYMPRTGLKLRFRHVAVGRYYSQSKDPQ